MQPDTEPPADPPPDVEALLALLKSRNPLDRAHAANELRRCGATIVAPLIALANEEAARKRHRTRSLLALSLVACGLYLPLSLYCMWHANRGPLPWLLIPLPLLMNVGPLAACRPTSLQVSIANLLLTIDDVRAVGPLAEALWFQAVLWQSAEAEGALLRLLPRLRAGDAKLFTNTQFHCLCRALTTADTSLRRAILHALEQIGDTRGVPYLEKLIASRYTRADIRRLAAEVLPALRERAEIERTGAHLLRPVQVDDSALLHPASATTTDATPLVRASEEPDRLAEATVNVQGSEM